MTNKDMWVEQKPKVGDTVQIEFSDFKNLSQRVGVVLDFFGDRIKIDFGDCIRCLCVYSLFLVFKL